MWACMGPYNLRCLKKKLRGALGGLFSSPKDFVFKGDEIFPQSFFGFSRSLYGAREEHTQRLKFDFLVPMQVFIYVISNDFDLTFTIKASHPCGKMKAKEEKYGSF